MMGARMLRSLRALAALGVLLLAAGAPQEPHRASAAARFEAWDVYVDTGSHRLGAYQFEWLVRGGGARIVGVEGGEHSAFAAAPYYDPAALQGGRILVAAFSTAEQLPRGRSRIARLHLMVDGGASPRFEVKLDACADATGSELEASVSRQRTIR